MGWDVRIWEGCKLWRWSQWCCTNAKCGDEGKRWEVEANESAEKVVAGSHQGFSTISHEAVRVIAGIIYLDLIVKERLVRRAVKEAGMNPRESKRHRREELWTSGRGGVRRPQKERETFEYVPDVQLRKRVKEETDHYTTQFVSGHGNFKAKLWGFNLVSSDRCVYCGVPELAQHVLMECKFFEEERVQKDWHKEARIIKWQRIRILWYIDWENSVSFGWALRNESFWEEAWCIILWLKPGWRRVRALAKC